MDLNLAHFSNAIARLEEGWAVFNAPDSPLIVRDGLIQRFEFTYEITHKMLKRGLQAASPTPAQFETMVYADLIRAGNKAGLLLSEWPVWKNYREKRAKTSHTYVENVALEVVAVIPDFLTDAQYLRDRLTERTA